MATAASKTLDEVKATLSELQSEISTLQARISPPNLQAEFGELQSKILQVKTWISAQHPKGEAEFRVAVIPYIPVICMTVALIIAVTAWAVVAINRTCNADKMADVALLEEYTRVREGWIVAGGGAEQRPDAEAEEAPPAVSATCTIVYEICAEE